MDAASAPWEVMAVCLLLLIASAVTSQRAARLPWLAGIALSVGVTLFASDGSLAYAAIGVTALLHAVTAARFTRTGSIAMGVSSALAAATALTIATGHTTAAPCSFNLQACVDNPWTSCSDAACWWKWANKTV